MKSGFGEETLLKVVQSRDVAFNLSVEGLTALKAGGVSERIIAAMLDRETKKGQAQDAPKHALDGVNATFLLANAPSPRASLVLTRNGVVLKAGADFTLVGAAITFAPEATPEPGDVLQAWYRY